MIEVGSYTVMLPEMLVGLGGLLLTLLAPFYRSSEDKKTVLFPALSALVLLGAFFLLVATSWITDGFLQQTSLFAGDGFSRAFRALFLLVSLLTALAAGPFLARQGLFRGELYALILFLYLGMSLLASSRELLTTFLGLEIVSVGSYVLLGFKRADMRSQEAAWKYFLLGSASSAVLLYGIALIYGAVGSADYQKVFAFSIRSIADPPLLLSGGLTLFFVGLAFKIALVPFHVWTADVYEGSPTLIAGFLASGPKAAAAAALWRFYFINAPPQFHWNHPLVWIAVASMTLGNLSALSQRNLKRMLAYSSIAHAGYLSMALFLDRGSAFSGLFLYLLAYICMTLGAFSVLALLAGKGDWGISLREIAGLAERRPLLAAAFALFLLSLTGIPLTAGFVAKFYVFGSAVNQGMVGLTIIAVINSAVSAYYYLRPVAHMYMLPSPDGDNHLSAEPVSGEWTAHLAIGIAVLGVLWLGVAPSYWLGLAERISVTLR